MLLTKKLEGNDEGTVSAAKENLRTASRTALKTVRSDSSSSTDAGSVSGLSSEEQSETR